MDLSKHTLEPPASGSVEGELASGEERAAIERVLLEARDMVLSGRAELLLHTDHSRAVAAAARQAGVEARLAKLRRGTLKRYVFAVNTAAGRRIIKIAEPSSLGNRLLGVAHSSIARVEHRNHQRAEALGLAATRTCGFVEWRRGPLLLRACQVQTPLDAGALTLDALLAQELARVGDAALDELARALAEVHRLRFFHADLKGFHAFPAVVARAENGAARYRLRWLDLGRVSFWLSPRKRVINLYQLFRFVLPERAEAQERFMRAYCRETGWCAERPERALAKVRRFLAHKLRTHPDVEP